MARDMNVTSFTVIKGEPQTLFGGAIAASVAEADATVIDMTEYTGGALEFAVNSGAGTYSIAVMTSEVATGVFKTAYSIKDSDLTQLAIPAIVTTTTVSATYAIKGIRSKYMKLVPTLTNACNATFKFTPNV